jgi:hypothetical protein
MFDMELEDAAEGTMNDGDEVDFMFMFPFGIS